VTRERIIADLVELRQLRPGERDFVLTAEELDALLAVVAERDALKKAAIAEWEERYRHE
jgi:hypothetical protein